MFRRGIALLVLLTVAPSSLFAQSWAEKMFDATSVDFGAVARGSKVEHRFKIKNLYKEDVHIAAVRSSCGCTSPEVTERLLKTHETTELIARFNTRTFLGHKNATVTVTFDEPFYAEVQLQVSGYIRSDVVLDPADVQFGSVDQGQPAERTVAVRYAGRDDWAISEVKTTNPYLTSEARETSRGGGQVGYDLVFRLKPEAPVGYLHEEIWVYTNDQRAQRFPVIVEGQIKPEVTLTPDTLFLGVVPSGQSITKNVIVRGKRPFRILDVECEDRCFSFKVANKSAPVHALRIQFTAGEKQGPLACKIHIKTDLESITVPALTAKAEIAPPVELSAAN